MATNAGEKSNGCTYLWKIKNFSQCCLMQYKSISSPAFIANALSNTKWHLELYPVEDLDGHKVSFYLIRESGNSRSNFITINCQLALLDKDCSLLKILYEWRGNFFYPGSFVEGTESREKIFVTERERFLQSDTLTVQCTMWKVGEKLVKPAYFSALTMCKVDRRSFVWKIDGFSSLKPGVVTNFNNNLMDIDIFFNEGLDAERQLVLISKFFDKNLKYFSFKICIIDSEGKKEDCETHEYFEDDLKARVKSTMLSVRKVMENRSRYLPNDILFLHCEYVYSDVTTDFYEIYSSGTISPEVTNTTTEKEKENFLKRINPQDTSSLVIDMKSMYEDGIFTDTELCTSTQTFPTHKLILSARSPVFRRMFNNDMKEKNSGHVDITDLDDDTMRRMILYIYTDKLEDLQLENAINLYAAADKYEILSLRSICSSFLKDNLGPTNVCDILIFADLHHDNDLKSAVQDYMLKNEEVYRSEEWKHIMSTDPKLAADTMHRKFLPG